MDLLPQVCAKSRAKIQVQDMDILARILARMWFCMGIRLTVIHLLKLLRTLPKWFPASSFNLGPSYTSLHAVLFCACIVFGYYKIPAPDKCYNRSLLVNDHFWTSLPVDHQFSGGLFPPSLPLPLFVSLSLSLYLSLPPKKRSPDARHACSTEMSLVIKVLWTMR